MLRRSLKPNDIERLTRDMEAHEDNLRWERIYESRKSAFYQKKGGGKLTEKPKPRPKLRSNPKPTENKDKKPRDLSKVICYNHQQRGHIAKGCTNEKHPRPPKQKIMFMVNPGLRDASSFGRALDLVLHQWSEQSSL